MIDFKISRRYAHALIEMVPSIDAMAKIDEEFLRLSGLLKAHPEVIHLVNNSAISRMEKEDFIEKIMGADYSQLLINFMKVLIRKKRFSEIMAIQEEFHRLFEKRRGIREVLVLTPTSLAEDLSVRLRKVLEQKLKSEIRLKHELQPAMLGGMILRFDGKEINMSYRDRLNEIKHQLTA